MERLNRVAKSSFEGMKSGLTAGLSVGAILNGLPVKWMRKSSILERIAQPDDKIGNDTARVFGFSMLFTGAAGAVIGAFKGMFGKAEEDRPEQKTAAEQPQVSQAVEHGESRQEEPLRSPDTTREKVHAERKEPITSRVAAEESRPKEGVSLGR